MTRASAAAPRRRAGRPPGPSQAAHLRARLIGEASQLYAAGGYHGLSFAVVAARTGMTKATVFHYFPTKDALLRGVFEAFGERLERAAEPWFAAPPAAYAERLTHVVEGLVEFYGRDPLHARILCHGLLEAERLTPWRPAGTAAPPVFDRFVRRFAEFIAAGIAAGEFYDDRPMAAIMAVGGLILFEFMLPEQGRRFRSGAFGATTLAARQREMATLVRRAVVRPTPARRGARETP